MCLNESMADKIRPNCKRQTQSAQPLFLEPFIGSIAHKSRNGIALVGRIIRKRYQIKGTAMLVCSGRRGKKRSMCTKMGHAERFTAERKVQLK